MEGYVIQLMYFSVVKKYVFGGGGSVAKAIANIKAKGVSVYIAVT